MTWHLLPLQPLCAMGDGRCISWQDHHQKNGIKLLSRRGHLSATLVRRINGVRLHQLFN